MGTIKVENIKVYAFHGCLEEEARIGSEYSLDVTVTADLSKSANTDDLKDTVDYVLLNAIVTYSSQFYVCYSPVNCLFESVITFNRFDNKICGITF